MGDAGLHPLMRVNPTGGFPYGFDRMPSSNTSDFAADVGT